MLLNLKTGFSLKEPLYYKLQKLGTHIANSVQKFGFMKNSVAKNRHFILFFTEWRRKLLLGVCHPLHFTVYTLQQLTRYSFTQCLSVLHTSGLQVCLDKCIYIFIHLTFPKPHHLLHTNTQHTVVIQFYVGVTVTQI